MHAISNLDGMAADTLGTLEDCKERAMQESIMCQQCDQVRQRDLRQYVFQDILKDMKHTFIKQ